MVIAKLNRRRIIFWLTIVCLGISVGFAQIPQQIQPTNFVELSQDQSIGQSFTSGHAGLRAIEIVIQSAKLADGVVHLKLRENSEERKEILALDYQIPSLEESTLQPLSFPTIKDSYQKNYLLELSVTGDGNVLVGINSPDSYAQGSLYINQFPAEGQLAFQLEYTTLSLAWGLFLQSLRWGGLLLLSILVFILPGWAILLAAWKNWGEAPLLTKIVVSSGTSLALYPVLMLWADVIHFHPGEIFFAWVPICISVGYISWRYRNQISESVLNSTKRRFSQIQFNSVQWVDLATLVICLLVIFVRLWAIRSLSIPMWGDSYQHTVITQLILENGGLFTSWLPYEPYESLTVHYGFSANSAMIAWVANIPSTQAVIWFGQIINFLSVFSLYPLAMMISKQSKWAGAGAILVAGLLTQMPNYYVNWGRYAQLTGQTILFIAIYLFLEVVFRKEKVVPILGVCGLLFAGMLLSYYRTPMFFLLFFPLILIIIGETYRQSARKNNPWLWKSLIVMAVTVFLVIPLKTRLEGGTLAQKIDYEAVLTVQSFLDRVKLQWQQTPRYYSTLILILSSLGLLIGLLKKNWRIASLPLGVLLLQAYLFGVFINLPLANFIDVFAIQIMLYYLFGLLIGYFIDQCVQLSGKRLQVASSFVLIGLALFLTLSAKNIADPIKHEYVTQPDQRAFAWIRSNTPQDALFLVDGFTIYNGTTAVGSDGGWWIPLLTNRANTMPAQYALLNEKPIQPGHPQWVVDVINTFREYPPGSPKSTQALCQWDITHVYIGQKQGLLGQPQALLQWQAFEMVPQFKLVYAQDRVKIFEFDRSVCGK